MSFNDWKITAQDWNDLIEENVYPIAVATEKCHNICMEILKNRREVTQKSSEAIHLGPRGAPQHRQEW